MVSTDDQEIADVAMKYGATVPFMRTEKASDDFAILADVIDDVKASYQNRDQVYDYICCILPTAPFVTVEMLNEGYKCLKEGGADSVKPIVRFSYPIQRAIRINKDGLLEMIQPEHAKTRSQDLEKAYHDAGLFYWMKYEQALNGNVKIGFEVSESVVHDIDTLEDWITAEIKFRMLRVE